MSSIFSNFTTIFVNLFSVADTSSGTAVALMSRLVHIIVGDPLIMAVASIFFVGVIIAFFMRVYHSIL